MSGSCDRLLKRSVKNLRIRARLSLPLRHQRKSESNRLRKPSNDLFVNLLRNPFRIRSLTLPVFRHQECFCFLTLLSLFKPGEAAVGL